MSIAVRLDGLTRRYPGGGAGLLGLDLSVAAGERLAVLGPSGAGKSTLLRLIAGLERADAGSIALGGQVVDALPPHERGLAMVFQEPAVYPHLSVFENLAFGLRAARAGTAEIRARVGEVAGRLGLAGELRRRPAELSGGQRQRVALGRALARRPGLLLLDEPFTALDAPLRLALRADLIALQRSEGFTMLHVTHDQAEALALGDRLAVLVDGRLAGLGPPAELYDRPPDRTVAGFLGGPPMVCVRVATIPGTDRLRLGDPAAAEAILHGPPPGPLADGPGPVDLGVRPEHLSLGDTPAAASEAVVAVRVEAIEFAGREVLTRVAAAGGLAWTVPLSRAQAGGLEPGAALRLRLDLTRASWFDPGTGARRDRG